MNKIFLQTRFILLAILLISSMTSCLLDKNATPNPNDKSFEGKMEIWELYTIGEALGTGKPGPILRLNNKLRENSKYKDSGFQDTIIANSDTTANEFNPLFSKMELKEGHTISDMNAALTSYVKQKDTAIIMEMLHSEAAKEILPQRMHFAWSNEATVREDSIKYFILYALKAKDEQRKAELSNPQVKAAFSISNPNGAGFGVSVEFDEKGTEIWSKMTAANIDKCLAICLDGRVMSAPKVMQEIKGGKTVISGDFSASEAQALAKILHPGK